ncbi:MAG: Hydantoinase/oxoprolinase family protein [Arenicellales bacterium IbO2]|nr:MAG: Hydantoinase/oxoprolinase family protein [Arenicellales bacterium IbO2]
MPMPLQLGIDTGGTYTDAVILQGGREVLAKHKSLTTGYDLSVGIGGALGGLPRDLLGAVELAALSTTLSTNSVVEGRGAPVAILLPGYSEQQIAKSGLREILPADALIPLAGGHDALGRELAPLDLAYAKEKIAAQNEKVSAFAVSGLFATRNNAHENALRELISQTCGKPVACGHELATALGAPRRALTAALNARMIPYITELIKALEETLRRHGVRAPLMIVKGDGSLVNARTALRQPLATVLSGPAASVTGACALSEKRNAIVVDIGGTTTDIAIVRDGRPELCADGARIGEWQPMIEAIRVFSAGLGGDSEVRFRGKLALSGRRVVPMSLLAHQFPEVLPKLEHQLRAAPNPRNNRFALRLQKNEALLRQLEPHEHDAWEKLADGPIELEPLREDDRELLRALAKMERMGLVIYSGFTPSDATHVLGLSAHWNARGAELGAEIWARQMRHLYGCGGWPAGDAAAPCREVFDLVAREISGKIIEAALNRHGLLADAAARNLTQLLAEIALRRARGLEPLFQLNFDADFPLVAVGGPAGDYFPQVAKSLRVQLHLPPHAEVANAVGAALGAIVQTARVTVTQPQFGVFYLFHGESPMVFEKLEKAMKTAHEIARREAGELAKSAGASSVETRVHSDDNHVRHDIDGELFVSATVVATATGRPELPAETGAQKIAAKTPAKKRKAASRA